MSAYLPYRRDPLADLRLFVRTPARSAPVACVVAVAAAMAALLLPVRGVGSANDIAVQRDRTVPAHAAIAARATTVDRRYDFVTVAGQAVNLSATTLKNTEAVVEFLDRDGGLLKVETALLELPTLAPGGDSSFSVETREVPGMATCRVRFRSLLGTAIPSRTD